MRRKHRKKGKITQFLEYGAARLLLTLMRLIPLKLGGIVSEFLGKLLYLLVPERRSIALENLRRAFSNEKDLDIEKLAYRSFSSFTLTCFESLKFRQILRDHDTLEKIICSSKELGELFQKARKIHEESRGCLFVTPHIGNWELLPHVSSIAGIPLAIVVRPLDNVYLEKLIYSKRAESGQVIIPKKNALIVLQKTLRQGKSIGMLPDQGTRRGISVPFFQRDAFTTPVPAMLSVLYRRPIVVVACCRARTKGSYEGVVSDPLWPGDYLSEKDEIYRLTERMNQEMEKIIRKYPEQYFWMHNRWKTYRTQKKFWG